MPGSPEDLVGLEDKYVAKDGGVISSEFGDCGGTTDLMAVSLYVKYQKSSASLEGILRSKEDLPRILTLVFGSFFWLNFAAHKVSTPLLAHLFLFRLHVLLMHGNLTAWILL